jgi:SPP1 family predicted phage head-tail adaptor
MDKTITLRSTATAPDANGVAITTNTDTQVYAERKSVKRTEFYAAQAAGVRADIAYVVNADDYGGQMLVVDGATVYKVTRTYQVGLGRVELTCTRR